MASHKQTVFTGVKNELHSTREFVTRGSLHGGFLSIQIIYLDKQKRKCFLRPGPLLLNVFQSQSNLVEDQKIRNTYVQYQTLVSVYEQ